MSQNLMSRNPEHVLMNQQIMELKHTQGCAVCVTRDRAAASIGGVACSIPGNYPRGKFCNDWQLDEGDDDVNNSAAA